MALKIAGVAFCLLVLMWMGYIALFVYRLERRAKRDTPREIPHFNLPPIPERKSPKTEYDRRPIVIDDETEWEREHA